MTLLSIGDFSRMTHLSVKALRHYHELGLLDPAVVDTSSGYRSYDTDQVATAQVIRRLRDLQMPLDQVKKVVDTEDLEVRNRTIVEHLSHMERQLEHTQAMVASLRGLLEAPVATKPVTYRALPAMTAVAASHYLRWEDFSPWAVSTFERLFRAIDEAGLDRAGPPGALYPGEFFEDAEGEVTAFVPVTVGDREWIYGDGWAVAEIPGAELAVMVHDGSFDDLDQTYGLLGAAVNERAIGVEGFLREYYVVGPWDTTDPDAYRTEVCWPVFRTSAGSHVSRPAPT